ncbi:DNA mismatch repair endonuclease MutL [Anthropogastromicrobium sp.]|uniref:DNA mismatch repair endonuclease MutL n=1 Tax=Anthropogastromicrobium sp. TaxID=2981649 RepID=UPI00307AB92D
MPEIQLLDQATINQIAAGEVIDRPSSVVKELLENAIDAKATAITVEIKDGGISFIRITDNGCGIEKDQVRKAFLRHATSKLHTIDDLLDIGSLGFRGEALSSIAAIAQVELISKPPEAMLGISYQIEDGEEKSLTQIGAPDGTTILVRNLFYHVPARKKFLKTAATEGNYINQLMENMAMLRPDISMRFINGGQNKLYTSGNGRLKDLIYTIYGREISSNVLEINYECPLFAVTGYIGKPIISRGNRTFENYYINGRFVKSRLIAAAIEQAYKPFMMQHRYPFTVLHIKIKPELIDVNVHPAKMEVRFQQENEIYELLAGAIENTLRGKEFIPDVSDDGKAEKKVQEKQKLPEPFEQRRLQAMKEIIPPPPAEHKIQNEQKPSAEHKTQSEQKIFTENKIQSEQKLPKNEEQPKVPSKLSDPSGEYKIEKKQTIKDSDSKWELASGIHKRIGQDVSQTVNQMPPQPEQKLEKPEQQTLFTEPLLSEKARIHHRLIGQLFDTYWLIQYGNQLYIMDQHAAHEKVNYERLMEAYRKKERITQFVSPPMVISLTRAEEAILEEFKSEFERIGFTIEPYGGREYAISEIPANLYGINEKELFLEMLSDLEDRGSMQPSELIASKLASMSCKAAIKGGQKISFQEADALVSQLLTLENPYACPHGRPTIITMTKYELEKKFKRIV